MILIFSLLYKCLAALGKQQAVMSKSELRERKDRRRNGKALVELGSFIRPGNLTKVSHLEDITQTIS